MPRRSIGLFLVALLTGRLAAQLPLTVAESSDFQKTSRHADVVAFCEALAKASPVVRLSELGTSGEGRRLPLLVLADPPVESPEQAARSGKPIVLALGNIHAGEVDGKEALLMLARDLTGDLRPLLKDVIVAIVPILNADGNEQMSAENRPTQAGPAEVGRRSNAAGLDLNRDFVKLESPEIRAVARFVRRWDPAVMLDCHTTNGSFHRYTLTHDGPRHPDAGAERIQFAHDCLLPEIGRRTEQLTGFATFPYGTFTNDRGGWESYPPQPRYGVQWFGLRGRISLLSESYSYAPFRDRVAATRAFARAVVESVARHKDVLKQLADAPAPDRVTLRTALVAHDNPVTVRGWVEREHDGRSVATDEPREYEVRLITKAEPTLVTDRPYAYLIPPAYENVFENLQRHGIAVEELREDVEMDIEIERIAQVDRSARPYQGRTLRRLETERRTESRRVPAGTLVVRTEQKLGALAALLLEARSEDGLAAWDFFGTGLDAGADYPVHRVPSAFALITTAARPLAEDRTIDRPFTDRHLLGPGLPPNLAGSPVQIEWIDDDHFLQVRGGRLCKVHARSGRHAPFHAPAKLAASLLAQPAFDKASAERISQQTSFQMNPARSGCLVVQGDDLYFAHFDGTPAVRLTRSPGSKLDAAFSPDGAFVAFTRGGNLFVTDLATQTERALTTDGGGAILNGRATWVYEEEIFNRNGRAFWWSPDSRRIAYLRFDDTPVHPFVVLNHLPTRLKVESTPYPKAGDPNPLVSLATVEVSGGEPRFVDLSAYAPSDMLVSRVGWTPDNRVYAYVQNRIQTWLDLIVAGPGGATKRLLRDATPAWIEDAGALQFLPDGSFLMPSDRTGWRHLYHYTTDGELVRPATAGEWEIREVYALDPKAGYVYFQATRDDPIGPNVYRAKLDGTSVERLVDEGGTRRGGFNPSATHFVESGSSFTEPTRVTLRTADGAVVRRLDRNPVFLIEEFRFGRVEHVRIPTPDGFQLEATITYPPDFSESRRHPVWVKTYGGPHAPTVSNAWQGGRVPDQVLAASGVVVLNVDPRSASGKGAVSAWACYKQLGISELADLETAVAWLSRQPGIDGDRVGLSGGSYGGFLTALALTHGKKFSAGISSAPVTDWRNYDSIYTERYMLLPQDNPDGYGKTSVVKAAKNLRGRLLLVHGLMDDNVHVQNAAQLIHELQRADKDFEVMLYPLARHGGFGRHNQRLSLEFIRRSLGVGAANGMRHGG